MGTKTVISKIDSRKIQELLEEVVEDIKLSSDKILQKYTLRKLGEVRTLVYRSTDEGEK